ncbi:hypothetical protein F4054_10430 [Candidatus Poribacteria bacterium]|nr:hypothetical protein [Candidatus Poribacteria bacterium]MYK22663.1 hypothetical protein [Candidatus Poribacteria bacterium]
MRNSNASNPTLKYVADLYNVKEVTLYGTADLSFWEAVLHKENLFPYHEVDKAVLLISAMDAKWRGFKFREFVIAVAVSDTEDGTRLDGYYLPYAFNSSKFLAFSERVFFRIPYFHANIRLENKLPASIKLQDRTEVLLHARMSIPNTPPMVEYLEWEGPIFLPRNRGKFFAVLAGEADLYPFSPETDQFELKPSARHQIFQQLIDSNFVGSVWSLRNKSRHAKSKTYKEIKD